MNEALEINAWYAFVIDGNQSAAPLYQYLGDGLWAGEDDEAALDCTPDYDQLVKQS